MFKKWFPALWKMYRDWKRKRDFEEILGMLAERSGYSKYDIYYELKKAGEEDHEKED